MPWKRGVLLAAAVAAVMVMVSSVGLAIRSGSWGPVVSVCWVPAAVVAVWPGAYRRGRPGSGRVRRADLRR
jgi:hypothetical protein